MKLILTHEVTGLGTPGDVVEVKDGYGRNFLLPRNLATPWTKGAEKQIDVIRKARKAREIASLDDAKAVKQSLESRTVAFAAPGRPRWSPLRRRHPGRRGAGGLGRRWPVDRQAQGRDPAADQDDRYAQGSRPPARGRLRDGDHRRRRGHRLSRVC